MHSDKAAFFSAPMGGCGRGKGGGYRKANNWSTYPNLSPNNIDLNQNQVYQVMICHSYSRHIVDTTAFISRPSLKLSSRMSPKCADKLDDSDVP